MGKISNKVIYYLFTVLYVLIPPIIVTYFTVVLNTMRDDRNSDMFAGGGIALLFFLCTVVFNYFFHKNENNLLLLICNFLIDIAFLTIIQKLGYFVVLGYIIQPFVQFFKDTIVYNIPATFFAFYLLLSLFFIIFAMCMGEVIRENKMDSYTPLFFLWMYPYFVTALFCFPRYNTPKNLDIKNNQSKI